MAVLPARLPSSEVRIKMRAGDDCVDNWQKRSPARARAEAQVNQTSCLDDRPCGSLVNLPFGSCRVRLRVISGRGERAVGCVIPSPEPERTPWLPSVHSIRRRTGPSATLGGLFFGVA